MMELSALDLRFLVRELEDLVQARVDKIYQPDGIIIQLHKTGQGKKLLQITPTALWITQKKPAAPKKIPQFCTILRKHLGGKKLISIEQIESERIIEIEFSGKDETRFLIIELFGNGNIILLDEDKKIITALILRKWKDRNILRKEKYKLPPKKINIFKLKEFSFEIEGNVSKTLAKLGFGKDYAKEICVRAKIDPEAKKLDAVQKKSLLKAYKNLLQEEINPYAYKGKPKPIKFEQYDDGKAYKTFSKAIEASQPQKEVRDEAYEAAKKQILKKIKLQQKTVADLEKKAIESQKTGDRIYEKYQKLKKVLEELNDLKKKHSLQKIKEKLKGHKTVKNIYPKKGDVEVEI